MSGAGRPDAVRRWVRRPLWWGAGTVAFALTLVAVDAVDARRLDRTFDRGHRVSGSIGSAWDGGRNVEVRYVHPETGDEVRAATFVWDAGRLPAAPGPVELEVSRTDPTQVVLAGDRRPVTANLVEYLPWALFPFAIWAVRRRAQRASEALVASGVIAYAMVAAASPPGALGLRWRLQLYPADADPAAPPVCSVPLIEPPFAPGPFPVEVKGSPRPFGRVVARAGDGAVLWPAGRALRSSGSAPARQAEGQAEAGRDRRAANGMMAAGALVLLAGLVGASVGTFAEDVRARHQLVTATATGSAPAAGGRFDVSVAYEWDGAAYEGTVTASEPSAAGTELAVRVDPESPARVWSTAEDRPPGTTGGALAGFGIVSGMGLVLGGAVLRARQSAGAGRWRGARSWRGLELCDGRLWYGGRAAVASSPRARLDPDALVVAGEDGSEAAHRWDDHAAAASPSPAAVWHLRGAGPRPLAMAAVWLVEGRDPTGPGRRLATQGWSGAPWVELPALADYLAATPAARAGLAHPERVAALLAGLASGEWREPPAARAGAPPDGHRDLHDTARAVLGRHARLFGERAVRGEPLPELGRLVAEVRAELARESGAGVGDEEVAAVIRRLLAGRWPFDALLG